VARTVMINAAVLLEVLRKIDGSPFVGDIKSNKIDVFILFIYLGNG
jgi:hypothetical protein